MADIDLVLERLVTDTGFRAALADDPAAALASYDLSEPDLQLLAGSLDDGDDAQRGVEQRTSKSAMVGLLASLTGGGGGSAQDLSGKKGGMASDLPKLDAASKDAAYLSEDSPPDEELRKLPGRPKAGEITLTRSQVPDAGGDGEDARYGYEKWRPNAARENAAPGGAAGPGPDDAPGAARFRDDPYAEDATRAVDRPKAGEITVTRAPAADVDGDGAADRWGHEKWTPNRASEQVAPAGAEGQSVAGADLAGEITNQVTWSSNSARIADDDFLTVEDE